MSGTPDLFTSAQAPKPPRPPRRARRVLMHFDDVGVALGQIATFTCRKCGYDSGWLVSTDTEVRRGKPCPRCNVVESDGGVLDGSNRTTSGAIGQP